MSHILLEANQAIFDLACRRRIQILIESDYNPENSNLPDYTVIIYGEGLDGRGWDKDREGRADCMEDLGEALLAAVNDFLVGESETPNV